MKKDKKENRKLVFGAMLVTVFLVGTSLSFIVTTDVYRNYQPVRVVEKEEETASWHLLPMTAANNSPAASGIINVFTIDTDHGSLDYDVGIAETDAWVYEHADAGGFADDEVGAPHEALDGTTPYDTGFDIAFSYQFTGAQAVDGGAWNISRVKAYCNSTDLSISSQLMEKSTAFFGTTGTASDDTGIVNFYLKDADGGGGSGFTIGIDQTSTIDGIKVYYYG